MKTRRGTPQGHQAERNNVQGGLTMKKAGFTPAFFIRSASHWRNAQRFDSD